MTATLMFLGAIIALLGGSFNKKWYNKLGAVVGGLALAVLPIILVFLSQK